MKLQMIQTHTELCHLLAIRCKTLSEEHNGVMPTFKAATKTDKATVFMVHLVHLYWRAEQRALKHGYVGVGCISFAEARLVEFQRRVCRNLGAN